MTLPITDYDVKAMCFDVDRPTIRKVEEIGGGLNDLGRIEKVSLSFVRGYRTAQAKHASSEMYFFCIDRVTVPILNVILRGGGQRSSEMLGSSDTFLPVALRQIARTFVEEEGALEMLLILGEKGPLLQSQLIAEGIPEGRILRIISELSKSGLITVVDNSVTLTLDAKEMVDRILRKYTEASSENESL